MEIIDTRIWFEEFLRETNAELRTQNLERRLVEQNFGIPPAAFSRFGLLTGETDASYVKSSLRLFAKFEVYRKIPHWVKQAQHRIGTVPVKVALLLLDQKMATFYQRMKYAVAHTAKDTIICYVCPTEGSGWYQMLESLCYHEYNHLVRKRLCPANEPQTLLDLLVSEGLAESFVGQSLGEEAIGPWALASPETVYQHWTRYREKLEHRDLQTLQSYLFGDNTQDLPEWLGYSVGYQLVQSYMKDHPERTMRDLLALPASEFLSPKFERRCHPS